MTTRRSAAAGRVEIGTGLAPPPERVTEFDGAVR
jgi:hypothetical protein